MHAPISSFLRRVLLAPIVWPISRILDKCVGRDIGTVYSQEELKRLMYVHCRDMTGGLHMKQAGNTVNDTSDLICVQRMCLQRSSHC